MSFVCDISELSSGGIVVLDKPIVHCKLKPYVHVCILYCVGRVARNEYSLGSVPKLGFNSVFGLNISCLLVLLVQLCYAGSYCEGMIYYFNLGLCCVGCAVSAVTNS